MDEHNGLQVRVTLYRDRLIVNSAMVNAEAPTPKGSGSRFSYGLNAKQVSRIRRAVDSMEAQGPTWFVTLTYPPGLAPKRQSDGLVNVVRDQDAKRHLSTWLKRVKRRYAGIRYVWVAEVQPKRLRERLERAIHFHLVVDAPIARDFLDESWSDVIGCEAYPNIQRVRKSAGAYLAKYITKGRPKESLTLLERLTAGIAGNRCGIDHETSQLLKPLGTGVVKGGNWADVARVFEPDGYAGRIGSAKEWLGIFWGFQSAENAPNCVSSMYGYQQGNDTRRILGCSRPGDVCGEPFAPNFGHGIFELPGATGNRG